jgi:hypothetical protein
MAIHKDALIAQRAYEIWEQAGRPHGLDRDHWYQASAEIEETAVVVNGDAPVHASPNSVVSGDAPVHGPAATVTRPEARTAPAKTKAAPAGTKAKPAPAARTAPGRTKAPAKPKQR